MLTARSLVTDRVHGLKLGADDYLCKPFEMSELVARVEALLRRSSIAKKNEGSEDPAALGRVEYKDFALDFAKGLVIRDGTETPLSAQEYKLLAWLASHPGEILSRERLLEAVWGYGNAVTTRTVDVHVAWLRQKLGDSGPAPRHILTIRGLGYRFMP
jgi:DNA-binding response OmpR family regulator